jgi:rod shape-determining protein MreC
LNEKSSKKSKAFLFLSLVVLSLAVLTVDSKRQGMRTPGAYFFPALSYLQKGMSTAWRSTRDLAQAFLRSRRLVVENRRLKQHVQVLQGKISQLSQYERENDELRKLLEFREKSKLGEILTESVGAEVIGRSPSNWYRTLVIDRGKRDGLRRDMIVVSGEGLVGKVGEVGFATSQVMLVLDEDSCVSASVERTKEHGIVQGQLSDTLKMKYLSGKTDAVRGDAVRSSGLGGVYPKGLLIGTVSDVERADYGLTMSAEVMPAVDFSRLEHVLVLRTR